ncbi:FkbM family methyltransferase [Skermanella stibiiresistens SB22]|uniref:FkbM family methyltransferase n=1 Tax=Skermanella stibiiresistens SB22 TaxID=1385369 RepID=W9H344_9PROT|nr:FkbM family methyltransferase [Skermanella stibiiresistens]EWY40499.1 FkbM family methyltransferase [Skermanella stibiiresistens SB22]
MSIPTQSLSHEDIVAVYEVLLGRRPESDSVIEYYRHAGSAAAVVRSIGQSAEFAERRISSPFHHYHSSFDPLAIMRRHAVSGLPPRDGHLTNFLGVVIHGKFLPGILGDRTGQVEDIPIPANWHADIAEWGAALRAVELARESFTMAELGCGWGCWMNNTGVASRRLGLKPHLIGVEGDEGHIAFAREACASNGFAEDEVTLFRGIAAASAGTALFPRQSASGIDWGLEPIFNATEEERDRALRVGSHDELPMIPLDEVIGDRDRLDLLHVDIQGGEADLEDSCIDILSRRVSYMVIGTHSRQIEGRLIDSLLNAGWILEMERPAIIRLTEGTLLTLVDGVQGWRNTAL